MLLSDGKQADSRTCAKYRANTLPCPPLWYCGTSRASWQVSGQQNMCQIHSKYTTPLWYFQSVVERKPTAEHVPNTEQVLLEGRGKQVNKTCAKPDFEALKVLYVAPYWKSFIYDSFWPNQGGSPLEAPKQHFEGLKVLYVAPYWYRFRALGGA